MKNFINWLRQLWRRLFGRSKKEVVKTRVSAERQASTQTTQTQRVHEHSRRAWTEEEIAFLRKHYGVSYNSNLAKHLNRSEESIAKKAQHLGLKKQEGFFGYVAQAASVERKRKFTLTLEEHLEKIMARKKQIGEFSVDLYMNDAAGKDERYVAKFSCVPAVTYHARCSNFTDALNRIDEYIDVVYSRQ